MSGTNKRPLGFGFRNPELLESRELLAGHGAILQHGLQAASLASASHAASSHFASSSSTSGAKAASQTVNLSVTLTDSDATSTATGTASFKTYVTGGVTESKLSVSISGAAASTTFDVAVGGVVVGQLTTDAQGAGKLVLSSDPTGTEQALPANFPTTIAAGTTVEVGTLSGALAETRHGRHGHHHTTAKVTLTGALADAGNAAAAGTVSFRTATSNGVTATKLAVSVTGATASTTFDVAVGGVVVGQLTTDALGAGKLVLSSNPTGTEQALPANFPTTIAAATTIDVGTLTGTLATPEHGGCHGSTPTGTTTTTPASAALRFSRFR